MTTQQERRAFPRFHPKPGSHIVYMEGFGEIRELSLNGVFVVDSDPLPVGERINFAFRFGTVDIPVQGIVRRSISGQGMGIELTEVSRGARNRLGLQIPALL
jgi:hypothetical protein